MHTRHIYACSQSDILSSLYIPMYLCMLTSLYGCIYNSSYIYIPCHHIWYKYSIHTMVPVYMLPYMNIRAYKISFNFPAQVVIWYSNRTRIEHWFSYFDIGEKLSTNSLFLEIWHVYLDAHFWSSLGQLALRLGPAVTTFGFPSVVTTHCVCNVCGV